MYINLRLQVPRACAHLAFIAMFALAFVVEVSAQSSDVKFPTPVTNDELVGSITPRDIGDARRTTHFYVFSGKQGDIFVNVESKNLDGDIDLYIADGLRPMMKIVLYGGDDVSRAAKSIYLRREDILILRVQARSVGDANGTYQVKFSGAFAPADEALVAKYARNAPPVITASTSSGTERVTSTGARIKPPVTATPNTAPVVATTNDSRATESATTKTPTSVSNAKSNTTANVETTVKTNANDANANNARDSNVNAASANTTETAKTVTPSQPVSSNSNAPVKPKKLDVKKSNTKKANAPSSPAIESPVASNSVTTKPSTKATPNPTPSKESTTKATSNAPMPNAASNAAASPASSSTSIETKTETTTPVKSLDSRTARLVVELKDGTHIERDMTSVQLMLIEDGRLVVITKDGQTMRHPLANIVRMAIEP